MKHIQQGFKALTSQDLGLHHTACSDQLPADAHGGLHCVRCLRHVHRRSCTTACQSASMHLDDSTS